MDDGRQTGLPSDLPPLREVIARHDLGARKSLGQHFLLDGNLTAKIARAAGDLTGKTVYEVGPGPGGLTRALLDTPARRVVAVEKDSRCLAALGELAAVSGGRLDLREADALAFDEAACFDEPAVVVANLPYNVSTALVFRWLDRLRLFEKFVLMFQKEVGERIVATPGSKPYGRLSVMVQWRCTARRLFDVPASAFTPPPKVTSSIIELVPRPEPLAPADPDVLSAVVAAAFGKRRKMLRASLRSIAPDAENLLQATGIDPRARAEELSVEEFCAISRAVADARRGVTDRPAGA
jgi:16S rRNA (adenine1518-N6/adenine1519-N6)-dimethyltransferase